MDITTMREELANQGVSESLIADILQAIEELRQRTEALRPHRSFFDDEGNLREDN